MFSNRQESLKSLQDLLKENTLEDLVKSHYLMVTNHLTESLAILHYGKIAKAKQISEMDSCRGLVVESFPPYKVVSRGYDRFIPKSENMKTEVNVKRVTIKEDGSLVFVFRYKGKYHIATMYDFADNCLAFSDKTYTELFLHIIDQPLEHFSQPVIAQIAVANGCEENDVVTLCFEMCSLENRVIKSYPTPKLFLTSVYGGADGNVEYSIPSDLVLPDNVHVVQTMDFPPNTTLQDIQDKVIELSKDDIMFEGVVVQTTENKRIKIKNPYYFYHHKLKYKNFPVCTPELIVPLIFDGLDEKIISNVQDCLPHDKLFSSNEMRKRRDYYRTTIDDERTKIEKAVEYIKTLNISNIKVFIDEMKKYDSKLFRKWSALFFHLFKNSYSMDEFPNYFISNIHNIFDKRDPFLSKTHADHCCKFPKDYILENQNNGGLGIDSHTCNCGSPMKLTELRTEMYRYRYCHCGEEYDFLNYNCWTRLMLCTNEFCTCTHEVNPYTRLPLGIPASALTKNLRLEVHDLINHSKMTRDQCYKRIQDITGKSEHDCHMAKFTDQECVAVLKDF